MRHKPSLLKRSCSFCSCCFQALEGGAASSDEDEEGDGSGEAIPKQPVSHSYAAEQQELKKAFLQAAEQALDDQEGEDAAAKGLIKRRKVAGAAGDNDEAADGAGKEQQVNEVSVRTC
jgi:hypothetical protein